MANRWITRAFVRIGLKAGWLLSVWLTGAITLHALFLLAKFGSLSRFFTLLNALIAAGDMLVLVYFGLSLLICVMPALGMQTYYIGNFRELSLYDSDNIASKVSKNVDEATSRGGSTLRAATLYLLGPVFIGAMVVAGAYGGVLTFGLGPAAGTVLGAIAGGVLCVVIEWIVKEIKKAKAERS